MTQQATTHPQRPAAAYIRMSGRRREQSPNRQREEIAKLAAQEGYQIPKENWFTDEAP